MRYSTGNDRVDAVGRISIVGNMTPDVWFHTIRYSSGKPNYLATLILADIVYWYRPQEVRDEASGLVVAYKKKFASDLLQRSYKQMGDKFGASKRQAADAINFLQDLGVIKKVFRTVEAGGVKMNNVLFIDIVPERLMELTHPKDKPDDADEVRQDVPPVTSERDRVSHLIATGDTAESNRVLHSGVTEVPADRGRVSHLNVTGLTIDEETNTETSPEITTEISPSSSVGAVPVTFGHVRIREEDEEEKTARKLLEERNGIEAYLREQLEYDAYMERLKYAEKDSFDGCFTLILNMLCTKKKVLHMDGDPIPAEVVKSVFMKLTAEDVLDVIERVKNVSDTRIDNIDGYILTSLYKQRATISARIGQQVTYDLYGEGRYAKNDDEGDSADTDDQYMAFIKQHAMQTG